jgi:Mrp family chromosome partitioning ATPase
VAVNLALALSHRGLRVGLLDADVYGPSLPHLLKADSLVVQRSNMNPKHILPLQSAQGNIKMLSFGHVNPKSGAPGSVDSIMSTPLMPTNRICRLGRQSCCGGSRPNCFEDYHTTIARN